jgi:hypothetical protein
VVGRAGGRVGDGSGKRGKAAENLTLRLIFFLPYQGGAKKKKNQKKQGQEKKPLSLTLQHYPTYYN